MKEDLAVNGTATSRVAALEADLALARMERDSFHTELTACREERDKLRLRLLDAELELAADRTDGEPVGEVSPVERQRALQAELQVRQLAQELAATHQTLSWRVTRPLRSVRRKFPR